MSTLKASHGTQQRSSYLYSFKSIKHIAATQDKKWQAIVEAMGYLD